MNDQPERSAAPMPAKDPMKSFRPVMAGALVLEAIVVALALPVIAQLGGGLHTGQGWGVIAIAVALLGCCWLLKWRWAVAVIVALQAALIAFAPVVPSVAVIGLVFLGMWLLVLWLRRDVAKRMAAGRLPSQQQSETDER